jgi:hypothetical protein
MSAESDATQTSEHSIINPQQQQQYNNKNTTTAALGTFTLWK